MNENLRDDNLIQLTKLYNEMLDNVHKMNKIIQSQLYDQIRNLLIEREHITQSIQAFKNSYNSELPQELTDKGTEILKIEKNNIELLKAQKNELYLELEKVKKQELFKHAYYGNDETSGRLLDYKE